MAQGIGVRYTESGARVLGLERSDDGLRITGITAGSPEESLEEFITNHDFPLEDTVVACGLCPGTFLSACMAPEDDIDETKIQDHLRWEIERKMLSDPAEYIIDYATAGLGFVFAGRRQLISKMKGSLLSFVTDVEPVALYNGSEGCGEIGDGTVLLVSVEAEGISSVLVQGGAITAMESFPIHEDDLCPVLAGLDSDGIQGITHPAPDRLSEYVLESINRITGLENDQRKVAPDNIVVAGGGVYIGELTDMIEKKSGIHITVSDPLAQFSDDLQERFPDMARMSAAFTTCYGLAARALEE